MPTDALTTLLSATGGAFLGKFVGPAAESLGKAAWERAQQLGTKATVYLAAVGREPQPVEPKLLLPLVQAACLETEPTLTELWAALLTNAADPAQRAAVQSAFVEVLRQLTPTDAQVLNYCYLGRAPITVYDEHKPESIFTKDIDLHLSILPTAVALAIDNLLRLRLCSLPVGMMVGEENFTVTHQNFRVLPTVFGQAFFAALSTPTH